MFKKYDVIVVGAGHAGCEAAYAAAQMGSRVQTSLPQLIMKVLPTTSSTRISFTEPQDFGKDGPSSPCQESALELASKSISRALLMELI